MIRKKATDKIDIFKKKNEKRRKTKENLKAKLFAKKFAFTLFNFVYKLNNNFRKVKYVFLINKKTKKN